MNRLKSFILVKVRVSNTKSRDNIVPAFLLLILYINVYFTIPLSNKISLTTSLGITNSGAPI